MSVDNYGELKTSIASWLKRSDLTSSIPDFIAMAEDRINRKIRIRAMEANSTLNLTASTAVDTVAGTANAITLTPDTAATAYARDDRYAFTASLANTSATTVDISGLGIQNIKKRENGTVQDLEASDIVKDATYTILYDGTQFLLVNPGAYLLPSRYIGMRRVYLDGQEKKLTFFPSATFWTRNAVQETGQPKIYTIENDFIIFAPVPTPAYSGRMLFHRGFASLSDDLDTNWMFSNARGLLLYGSLIEASPFIGNDSRALTWATLYDQAVEDVEEADKRERYPDGPVEARSEVSGP